LREGHNTNFIGIEAMHALKRVVAWQTFSVRIVEIAIARTSALGEKISLRG